MPGRGPLPVPPPHPAAPAPPPSSMPAKAVGLPARVAAIAAQLDLAPEGSLVATINGAWGLLFGGKPRAQDGLLVVVQTLEEALHGSPSRSTA